MAAFSTTKDLKATYNTDNILRNGTPKDIHVELMLTKLSQMSLSRYFKMELLNTYDLETEHAKFEEKIEKVNHLLRIPLQLEKFLTFAFILALDSFLFMVTLLPVRIVIVVRSLWRWAVSRGSGAAAGAVGDSRVLQPAQICDVIRLLLTVVCCCSLQWIDLAFLYHQVRGQNVLKVYIMYNMLDVADRLFSTLGQDVLDTVFWAATSQLSRTHRNRDKLQILSQFALASAYIFAHSIVILLEATTLSVAFNSHNKSLLIVMMSNNFAELKGTVFKKFDKSNLYQLTCSDVRERLHLLILLCVVSIRNLREMNWDAEYLAELVPELILVMLSEILVDWVKHCFIAKFNEIPADVYSEYAVSLALDMLMSKRKNAVSEHCDMVARKMGHNPIPLICVLHKTFQQILFADSWTMLQSALLWFPVALGIKALTSIYILRASCAIISDHRSGSEATQSNASASAPPSPQKAPQSAPHFTSASLEMLNNSEQGSAPLFTQNSTVDLIELHPHDKGDTPPSAQVTRLPQTCYEVETIEASQSDDELVRQTTNSPDSHMKAE